MYDYVDFFIWFNEVDFYKFFIEIVYVWKWLVFFVVLLNVWLLSFILS